MFSIQVMGGLGNQLFQIFTALAYSLKHDIRLLLPKNKHDEIKRPSYWDTFLKELNPILVDQNIPFRLLQEKGFEYVEIPKITNINFKLFGYFQSYKYFEEQYDQIYEFLKIDEKKVPVKEKQKIDYENTISLHFRIGDYKPIQEHHPVMPIEYYIKSLEHIIKKTNKEDWNILYFYEESDDADVKKVIDKLVSTFPNVRFISVDHRLVDYEQMLLMSMCSHNIIANSSFSWWGAYFNTNKEKTVCYPSLWFGRRQGGKNIKDLCPETWDNIKDINLDIMSPKVLIFDSLHHKNKIGLIQMLKYLNYDYKFGDITDINNYDIIYSPGNPIDTSLYPDKKFIFGPHFSVFPNNKLLYIKNSYNNAVYIQPSYWASNVWKNMKAELCIPIRTQPFPVEIEKFKPTDNSNKSEVFIYFKRRKASELNFIKDFLNNKKISYKIFDYLKKYEEDDYISCLKNAKYGIIVDAHESQGFAIEEALSCNVPLIVWNVEFMSQEEGGNYSNIPCTNIEYWDERCGEFFYREEEFEEAYNKFMSKIDTYKPREYILEHLTPEKCSEQFVELINSY